MPDYRLYVMDDEGHFLSAIDLVCTDDQDARMAAAGQLDDHDLELWQGERKVDRLASGVWASDRKDGSRKRRGKAARGLGFSFRLGAGRT